MISDFICLEEMEGSENSVIYMFSLPDPNLEHGDDMVLCGYVQVWQDLGTDAFTINIELLDNFKELCDGDTYHRKQLVSTIMDIVSQNTGFDLSDSRIQLQDYIGRMDSVACSFELLDGTCGGTDG